jgi:hypothetical protein
MDPLGILKHAFTCANLMLTPNAASKGLKIWKTGFTWGMLNCVPRSRHEEIYETICYDSGNIQTDFVQADKDPERTAYIDETRVVAPVLTIGVTKDRAVPVDVHRKIGEKYKRVGGDYLEYADNAHWILDEPGTDRVIADIASWLDEKGVERSTLLPKEILSMLAA